MYAMVPPTPSTLFLGPPSSHFSHMFLEPTPDEADVHHHGVDPRYFSNAIAYPHHQLFFLNRPLLTSRSCFWNPLLVKPMFTFLEQILLASCLYSLLLSTTSFHCLHTSSTASSSLKLRWRNISSRTSGLSRASGLNKTTGQVEPELSLVGGESSAVALEGKVVDSFGVGGFFDSSFVEEPVVALCEAPVRAITH